MRGMIIDISKPAVGQMSFRRAISAWVERVVREKLYMLHEMGPVAMGWRDRFR